ncbi:hypothetical protein ES705_35463 [subsurface metagenome]
MVKITNRLGDVKIGKQGEVVYQRKYGQQIRRAVSPKRAIPSQGQIAHRQLYRDALTWRSQLSLANRRYLDDYCISNRVVDSYHIPLPWSRFALKLYLQAIRFKMLDFETGGEAGSYGKFEYFDVGGNTAGSCYQNFWQAQTFTPQVSHQLEKIIIYARKALNPTQDFTLEIRATDAQHKPTGAALVSKSLPPSSFTTSNQWIAFIFPTMINLDKDTEYAIVCHSLTDFNNRYEWRANNNGGYPRGQFWRSTTSGSSWDDMGGAVWDFYFQEWGYIPATYFKRATIHVKHPALLTIVHKRGELLVNGYDNLSSLDGEYLTGQVGVDVEGGDDIEATTLPGITASYHFPE